MNVALIFAGGVGSRMNSRALPKQFLEINGKPVIIHTLEHFENHPDIDAIAVALIGGWHDHFRALLHRYDIRKVRWIVEGGETGQASRHKMLQAVANECADDSVVLLHDGVRPLINHQLITENIEAVRTHGSAITCTKFNETVTVVHDDAITEVIPRDHIYAAQAPQSFRLGEILALYDRAVADGEHDSIDSCTLMKRYDHPLHAIEGPRSNIKVTTAEDFYVCRTFFQLLEDQQIAGL